HRLLGRVIVVVFLVPFLYLLARRRIGRHMALPLAGIFLLGGLQVAVGWYMVKSGLVDDPRVSSILRSMHLGLAFLIYAAMLCVRVRARTPAGTPARAWANALGIFALLQVCVGIATLVLRVPLPLAALHQSGAVVVFTCAVGLARALRPASLQP